MSLVGWVGGLVGAALVFLGVTGCVIAKREERLREQQWWRRYVAERAQQEQA